MRRFLVPVTVALAFLLGSVLLASAATLTATAEQHPIGGTDIHGLVHFTDDGAALTSPPWAPIQAEWPRVSRSRRPATPSHRVPT